MFNIFKKKKTIEKCEPLIKETFGVSKTRKYINPEQYLNYEDFVVYKLDKEKYDIKMILTIVGEHSVDSLNVYNLLETINNELMLITYLSFRKKHIDTINAELLKNGLVLDDDDLINTKDFSEKWKSIHNENHKLIDDLIREFKRS